MIQNGARGFPGSIYSLILRFLVKAKKLDFSMRFWGDQKTRKIYPWSAKGSKKAPWRTITNG
jgi:hypothetical protein